MKTFRLLAAALFLFALGTVAPAQESNELSALRAKAEKGNGIAQYNLGLAYAEGRGVAADRIEAYVWLSLARENGARGRALDNLVASFDKATFDAAQQRLADRKGTAVVKGPPAPGTRTEPAPQQASVETPAATPETRPNPQPAEATPAAPVVDPAALAQQITALTTEKQQSSGEVAQARKEIDGLKAELARTKQSLATLEQAPRPAADPAALEQKTRELQAATAELENARNFGRQVEDTLNRVNDQKAALEAALAEARKPAAPAYPDLSGKVHELEAQVAATNQQIESVAQTAAATRKQSAADLQTAGEQISQLKTALAAKPAAPAYPDLSRKVSELEGYVATLENTAAAAAKELGETRTQLVAARSAAPAYPDLSGRVRELEAALAAKPAAPAYPDLSGHVAELEAQVASDLSAVAAIKAEAGRAQQEVAALTQAKAGAEQRATELNVRVNSLEQQNAELAKGRSADETAGKRVTELTAGFNTLQQRAAALESELAAAQTASAETSRQMAELGEKVSAAEKQSAILQQERDALSTKLTELAGEITQLRDDRERMQKLLADAGEKLQDSVASASRVKELEAQAAGLQSSLAAAEAQANGLTSERDTARAAQNELRDTIAKLEQEKKQLAAAQNAAPAYPDLSGKVRELESAAADSARQLATAGTAQSELQRQLADATTALQNAAKTKGGSDDPQLRRERDELSGRVTGLASEIAQLRTDRERMQKLLADSGKQLLDSTADASRIKELETQVSSDLSAVASAKAEASQAKEQITALTKAKEEAQAQTSSLQNSLAAKSAAPAYPDLSGKVSELETQLNNLQTALAAKSTAPTHPDLSDRVSELEAQLAAAPKGGSAPTDPNLAGRVVELETALADTKRQLTEAETALHTVEQARPAPVAPEVNPTDLQKQLAETEDKLATALRGYALLERERDAQAAKASQAPEAVTTERNSLAAQVATLTTEVEQLKAGAQSRTGAAQAEISRLNESLTALQRSTAQNSSDLAATRALLQQMHGANAVLAGENYQLKTMLAPNAGVPGPVKVAPVSAPPAARTHVVVSGDSLSRISRRYYGTANRWQEIYNANRDIIGNEGVLRVGTELRIP